MGWLIGSAAQQQGTKQAYQDQSGQLIEQASTVVATELQPPIGRSVELILSSSGGSAKCYVSVS